MAGAGSSGEGGGCQGESGAHRFGGLDRWRDMARTNARCLEDLHAMLVGHGDWMPLRSADEQKPAAAGTVEAWARAAQNPVKGFYGLRKGLRGRFANYVPPVLELLGLAEVEHNPKNNRMRAAPRG